MQAAHRGGHNTFVFGAIGMVSAPVMVLALLCLVQIGASAVPPLF